MHCVYPAKRDILRQRTDYCFDIFNRFNLSASKDDFKELVAAWSRMLLAMDACGPYVGGTTPEGGKMPRPKQVKFG